MLAQIHVRPVRAQDSVKVPWYQAIDVKGMLMTSVGYNFFDDVRTNQLRVFDIDNQSFMIDLVTLSIRREAGRGVAGFRVDVDAGPRIPQITHAVGLEMGKLDLRQAYISYIVPLGKGLTVDAGKFVTPAGYEVIEGPDALNDNATHSFLFGYAIPFTHTGIRLTYPITDEFSVMAMGVNGWDNVIDNNESPSAGGQLSWKPSASTSVIVTGIIGPEVQSDDLTRTLVDLAASTKLDSSLMIGVSADYGREKRYVFEPYHYTTYVHWQGVAGYLKVDLSKVISLSARAEVFDDPDGVRTGREQSLHEYTLTPAFVITPQCTVKLDLRLDRSTAAVFNSNSGQSTVRAYMYYTF